MVEVIFVRASKIINFVNFAINNIGLDLLKESMSFFSESDYTSDDCDLVVPELLKLIKPKRALVVRIVKEKTNCSISPSPDEFTLGLKIKEIGDTADGKTYDWEDE